MFNPQEWIEKSWNDDDTKMVKIAGEEAKIRRLKGTQWEQYLRAAHSRNEESAVALVLQYGLVKGFGNYTYEEMAKFYDNCPALADQLAGMIVEHTIQCMEAEARALEDAEKNFEATATPSPSTDGAGCSVKTRKKQSQAEENCSSLNSSSD
jgi:hypothetical protein